MYFCIREVIADTVDNIHALNDIPNGTKPDNEKFGHVVKYFPAKIMKIEVACRKKCYFRVEFKMLYIMRKHIPNLITCLNVTSGTVAVFLAFHGELLLAASCVLLAMFFDFFDGLAARLLHVKSDMGKELDSLADSVSFGLVPAVLAYFLIKDVVLIRSFTSFYIWKPWVEHVLVYSPVIIPGFSIYRLAKFNLDSRQTHSFIGMPTPANALFWVLLVFTFYYDRETFFHVWGNPLVLALCVFVFSALLVSELPMFSLKIKNFSFRENKALYIFIGLVLIVVLVGGWIGLSFMIPLYVLVSLAVKR